MPRPCTVCAHLHRADIDRRLSFQVVNMAEIAREYGLHKDAVRNHRAQHLPTFLAAFQARADALTLDTLHAEAQRLYTTALDALARAEAGVLTHLDDDGTEHRRVSSTAVARLLREARSGLDLLVKLAADGPTVVEHAGPGNPALDDRIALALDRALARVDGGARDVLDVEEADVVSEPEVSEVAEVGRATRSEAPGGTPGPGPGRAPGPLASQTHLDSDIPPDGSWETRRKAIEATGAKHGDPISPAASREELKAAGYATD